MSEMLGRPWLIETNAFDRLVEVEMTQGEPSGDGVIRERPYAMEGTTAVISVTGPLIARHTFMSLFGDYTSYQDVESALAGATEDAFVEEIRLSFDSPGGDAMGVQQLGELIYGCKKRVVAHVVGQCQSAAYWLASQCDAITAAPSALIGSIGTILRVRSDSDSEGAKVFRSSPYKHADPGSKEGKSQYQQIVDDLTALFVENVARGRGVSEQEVIDSYGNGATMVASRALNAGLIDGIQNAPHTGGSDAIMPDSDEKKGDMMADNHPVTAEEFEALSSEHERLVAEMSAMEAKMAEMVPKGIAEGLRSELDALQGAKAQAEAVAAEAAASKAKAEEDLAVGVLLARGVIAKEREPEAREAYGIRETHPIFWERLAASEPDIPLGEVGHGVSTPEPTPKVKDLSAENFTQVDAMVKAYCKEHGLDFVTDYGPALRAVKENIQ